jgi:hypothetical protein
VRRGGAQALEPAFESLFVLLDDFDSDPFELDESEPLDFDADSEDPSRRDPFDFDERLSVL